MLRLESLAGGFPRAMNTRTSASQSLVDEPWNLCMEGAVSIREEPVQMGEARSHTGDQI